jgi:mannose-6-phosphate isomerase-like protein (cupin superfamily)
MTSRTLCRQEGGSERPAVPRADRFARARSFFQAACAVPEYGTVMKKRGIYLPPGGGRAYPMGRIASVFLADGAETGERYAISEWWLEPNTKGPGPHSHDEDDAFYVIEGTMSILLGDRWVDAPRGSFVLVTGGLTHDFENRSEQRAGLLNIKVPGKFEDDMPGIAAWFAEHPPENAV